MDEKEKQALLEDVSSTADEAIRNNLKGVIDEEVAKSAENQVKKMRMNRVLEGEDITGLDKEYKTEFARDLSNVLLGKSEKAALLEESDQSGGYLVPEEVNQGIQRIAATAGYVARDARRFPMSSDALSVPIYTGADKTGEYVGEDEEGTEDSVDFGDARLQAATWQNIFRFSNPLLADANVDVADWVMALAGEGMGVRMDKEGFQGGTFTGSPFVGILGSSDVTSYTLGDSSTSGNTSFSDFSPADASRMIGQVETSILNGCAFYVSRTVWAELRAQKDNGNYVFGQSQLGGQGLAGVTDPRSGIAPAGDIWGYPVYTTDQLPGNDSSATGTDFIVFGNLREALYWGDRERTSMMRSEHATVGNKNLFKANQTAVRINNRHAITIGLPSAAVVAKTADS